MRHLMTFALALLVSFTVSTSAEAKKPKKGTDVAAPVEAPADAAAPVALEMTMVGIADVDNVFQQAVEPLQIIRDTRNAIDNVGKNLGTALGLAEGAPLADALADLKTKAEGKINVAVGEGGMPTLAASDAVPANVQTAIDAVNSSMREISALVPKLASMPDQFKQIATSAAAINPQSLISSGVKPLEAPKMMKTISANLKVLSGAPAEITGLIKSIDDLKSSISSSFGGGAAPATP
jgi:hypothetical protein